MTPFPVPRAGVGLTSTAAFLLFQATLRYQRLGIACYLPHLCALSILSENGGKDNRGWLCCPLFAAAPRCVSNGAVDAFRWFDSSSASLIIMWHRRQQTGGIDMAKWGHERGAAVSRVKAALFHWPVYEGENGGIVLGVRLVDNSPPSG